MAKQPHEGLAPWDLFRRHARQPYAFFLDRAGAPSFAGSQPSAQLVVERDGGSRLWQAGAWKKLAAAPVEAISRFVEESRSETAEPSEWIGRGVALPRTVGYLAYELGRFIEEVPACADDPVGAPLAVLSTYDSFDVWLPDAAGVRTVRFADGASTGATVPVEDERLRPAGRCYETPLAAYMAGFDRVMRAIRAGEIYQANLSRRMAFAAAEAPDALYARLRERQPVPQGAFLEAGGFHLLSNSPECFLRIDGERISTFPIKGTRRRALGSREDARLRLELENDPKEQAEHVMIVDLERNDLGRISRTGSVSLAAHAQPHTFATLHHLISEVRGVLRNGVDFAAVLRACFPGGSITGTPKIKAMEIIAEVEGCARGVYTGAIGCMNGGRSVELNIAIRTAVHTGGRLHYSSGGAVVADSVAEREHEETQIKARAFEETVQAATGEASAAL